MKNYLPVLFVLCAVNLSAQNYGTMGTLPTVAPPQPPNPYQYQNNLSRQPANPYNPNAASEIQKRNEAVLREVRAHEEARMQRQIAINSFLRDGFPSYALQDPTGTSYFYQAFEEIQAMLEGKAPLNLGRTIFLIENAYYGNKLDYSEYQNFIKQKVQLCQRKIAEEKLDGNNNMVKNMMLFRLIADTLQFKGAGTEKMTTHLPIQYDHDDYDSQKHFDSHFITKLMHSGIGQCHSMPLYYLILAEAMGAEAYWSLAPHHGFIKIKDEKNAWYNIELTCGAILSDAHYMNHNYIKAEAIRSNLYLSPLDKKDVISEMLSYLTRYYYRKYGFDNFLLQCVETVLLHSPNKLSAVMIQYA
jgi:regulator of sirC expression with transglutaminase-like and TPR domain